MGNFFEDLVHQVMDITMEDNDQMALKARGNVAEVEITLSYGEMYFERQNSTS
jgi:hypothetical protein